MSVLLQLINLHKSYFGEGTSTDVLNNISLSIDQGEFVAIMGPSGSGKSTLLHILGFLDKPSKGKYLFEGKSITEYSEEEIAKLRNKKMGFVFQSFHLLARTSVLENVKLPLLYSDFEESTWEKRARQAIDAVSLSHRINHEPSQLSGGERQRVAIARALVMNPPVIFADEPTGNLDSKSGETVMEILKKLHRDHGHTIILITHDLQIAAYAQRLIHIRDGIIKSS